MFSVRRTFGAKCAKCGRSVGAGDWVRRARERVYHLACFACDACSRQLSTGEQFALLDARLLCKAHYLDVVEGNNTSSDGETLQILVTGGKRDRSRVKENLATRARRIETVSSNFRPVNFTLEFSLRLRSSLDRNISSK